MLKSHGRGGMSNRPTWKKKVFEVIFEADTPAGKAFDLALIVCIMLSVVVVMVDSVESYRVQFGTYLHVAEWLFTIAFTIEYILRLICVAKKLRYATSFFGVIDLLSILPTYISLLIPGMHYLLVVRILRVLRIFRILKLGECVKEAGILKRALIASRRKILIFFAAVLTIVVIMGSLMYLIEGPENGFANIPRSVYWAIVTLTTVGYGDISPHTALGRSLASIIMIMGYSIIAVPSGIVTVHVAEEAKRADSMTRKACHSCSGEGHDRDADYCKFCGTVLKSRS